MVLPKNAFTTSEPVRVLRKTYRERLRPVGQDLLARGRSRRRRDRGNLPTYVIAGVNKSGTTALQSALCSLPSVGTPLRKEVHYLDEFPHRPVDWYRAHFWGDADLVWGEATPEYFDTPGVAQALATLVPDLRVVILLREPVGRAVSHFHNAVDHRSEPRSLEDAVAEEVAALREGRWPMTRSELNRAYVARSCYDRSLPAWLDRFGPDRVLVLAAEESEHQLARVVDFLGIDPPATVPAVPRLNERTYPRADPAVLELIASVTDAHTAATCGLLGWPDVPAAWDLGAPGPVSREEGAS